MRSFTPLVALAAAAFVGGSASTAAATTFTVNSTADAADSTPGDGLCRVANVCTLRAAVDEARALPGIDDIVLPAGLYQLTGSGLKVDTFVNLTGAGARSSSIFGTGSQPTLTFTNGLPSWSGISILTGRTGVVIDNNADVTLDGVAIKGNEHRTTGPIVSGGGVRLTTGSLTISNSTIEGNTVEATDDSNARGGGISVGSETTLIATNTTISGNQVIGGALDATVGGGIASISGNVRLQHVTFNGNAASGGRGGSIYRSGTNTLAIANSIVAGGVAQSGANCYAVGGTTTSGKNLVSDTSCLFAGASLIGFAPGILPIANNGGQTDTLLPVLSSSAVNAATACAGATDQRGAATPAGPACDLGAVELGAALRTTLVPSKATAAPSSDVTFVATFVNDGPDTSTPTSASLTFPAGTTIGLVSPSQGICTGTTCALGALARGASATVTVVAQMPASGALSPTATASSPLPEANVANNTAGVTVASTNADGGGSVGSGGAGDTGDKGGSGGAGGEITGGAGAGSTPPDRTAPKLGSLQPKKPRTGKPGVFTTSLDEPAALAATVDRLTVGRRKGASCTAKQRTGKVCAITRRVGAVASTAGAGAVKLTLPAKLPKSKLAPGNYRLTVIARDAAGNASAPRTVRFTIRK